MREVSRENGGPSHRRYWWQAAGTSIMLGLVVLAALAGWHVGLALSGRGGGEGPSPAGGGRAASRTALAAEPVHVVRPGETLYRIARRYGVTVDELARYNQIADPTQIEAGQRIRIPPGAGQGGGKNGQEGAHRAGERDGQRTPAGKPGGGAGGATSGQGGGGTEPATGGIVALTFDDGPDPAVWPGLFEALDRAGVKATFFVEGARAREHPELIRELARRGHQVENHGWSHKEPALLGERETRAEIRRTAVLIRELTGRRPIYYRPPGGLRDPEVFRWAQAEGHRVLLWTNIGVPDQPPLPPGQLASRLAANAYNGAILMLHATEPRTVEALPAIIGALRERGLRPVTVDELMEALRHSAAGSSQQPAPGSKAQAGEDGQAR